jgi:CxxC motif-containing protein
MGCRITVKLDGDNILSVEGNTCKRGDTYARTEVTAPVRTVTTTIKVINGVQDRISCKTKSPVPKEKIFDVMEVINKAACEAPVKIGDILIENAADTGVPVVATKDVDNK